MGEVSKSLNEATSCWGIHSVALIQGKNARWWDPPLVILGRSLSTANSKFLPT